MTLLGQTLVILGDPAHAFKLLEKRSSNYSDRPTLIFGGVMVGWDQTMALLPYGDRFKEHRRFAYRLIGSRANVERFHGLVEKETHGFLRRLKHDPEHVAAHVRK